MRAIFVTDQEWQYKRVYDQDVKNKLAKLFTFDTACYNKDMLLKGDFKDVECIFGTWGMPVLTESEIKKVFPKLKYIFYSAGTVKYFAEPYLKLGIRVFSAWQANAVPVIEYATSQILLATKGFFQLSTYARKNYKDAHEIMNIFPGNYHTKIGILGYGAIAKGVVKELLKHNEDIYVYAPNITHEEAKTLGVHKVDKLEEIFDKCIVISNHIANLPSTVGMINKDLINRLKDNQTFINTGRGQQVDEKALLNKCKNNPKICAVLDVTYPEPPEQDSLYFKLTNVTVTPHIAGSSGNEVVRMSNYMYEEALRVLHNEKPKYEIDLELFKILA
ncbi:MAG: phosphoglycerate dehydrogenase [Bacilli bacterium]|nr:phosphoglycerate dehydrogenase [Bacilli bacterium]